MNLSHRPSVVRCVLVAVGVLLSGCTGELKKENAELKAQTDTLAKAKASLEVELTKKSVELDGLKERLSEAKKREDELNRKLSDEQKDSASLRTQLASAKDDTKDLLQRAANLSKELNLTKEELRKQLAEAQAKQAELKAKQAEEQNRVTVDLQASVSFQNGDTKPVASVEFVVLNRSFVEIANQSGVTANMKQGRLGIMEMLPKGAMLSAMSPFGPDFSTSNFLSLDWMMSLNKDSKLEEYKATVQKHAVANFKTDMNGTASLADLPAGKYWIVGSTKVGKYPVVWDYPATIEAGKNRIHLDATNAVFPDEGFRTVMQFAR